MAATGEDEVEYESDPEEAKWSLTMRRREASDDEEEGDDGERDDHPRSIDSRTGIGSDGEFDGQGAPAEYDDEESDMEEEELEAEEEVEEEAEADIGEGVGDEEEFDRRGGNGIVEGGNEVEAVAGAAGDGVLAKELDGDGERSVEESSQLQGLDQVEEEKKENEPFAVPTAGAFYMHDDRFRDNAGGRHRYWHQILILDGF